VGKKEGPKEGEKEKARERLSFREGGKKNEINPGEKPHGSGGERKQ